MDRIKNIKDLPEVKKVEMYIKMAVKELAEFNLENFIFYFERTVKATNKVLKLAAKVDEDTAKKLHDFLYDCTSVLHEMADVIRLMIKNMEKSGKISGRIK